MQVYHGFDTMEKMQHPVVSVGSFDGVHLGHCRILQYIVACARERNTQSVVVTFDPHPQCVLHPESDFITINSLEVNLNLIEAQGVDVAVVVPFTPSFSAMTYVEFVEKCLIGKINVGTIVMGPNHAIGHNREGRQDVLRSLCEKYNVDTVKIPELMIHESGVHSAQIRQAIKAGNWTSVDEMLGYHYVPTIFKKR